MTDILNIVWLRRDLRLHDHATLAEALQRQGAVQLVFIFDTEILEQFPESEDRRLSFIAHQLVALEKELHTRGGGLLVLHGKAREMMPKLCAATNASALFAARDVEPGPRARDKAIFEALKGEIEMVGVWDHLLMPPGQVLKDDGTPYRVFTPYYKQCRKHYADGYLAEHKIKDNNRYADIQKIRKQVPEAGLKVLDASSASGMLKAIGYREVDTGPWQVSEAHNRLEAFTDEQLADYKTARNDMGKDGTSQLSPYLRFGLLSVRECARLSEERPGYEKWLSELAWRDFYAMIMYHFPEVVEQEFQEKYRDTLKWENNEEHFRRWQEGMTGYPVVDAAMRQLAEIGWMHNRARMIVASFLTKDLLIDWRWGEQHFGQLLMDYDLASNNGGWQWAASTGTDAQPYFRIFNPVSQGEKFDSEGEYVRRFVPELKDMETKHIHAPWKHGGTKDYPEPVVDHSEMRKQALAMYKAAA